ncbi:MAG: hypothetical protein U1F36_11215 [Planctomycetota bacterium]
MRSPITSRSSLGEAHQHVERQPAHAGRGRELLRDADEGDLVALEEVDQLGEVAQRAAQAVDLVDDHDVDEPALDILEQPLEAGAVRRRAGEAAVVVARVQRDPALALLAPHACARRPRAARRGC